MSARRHFGKLIFTICVCLPTGAARAQDAKPLVITGELTAQDPFDAVRTKSHCKVHELELKAGQAYVIDLKSNDFDTFLRIEDPSGRKLDENDDASATDQNSQLLVEATANGLYRAVATSFDSGKMGKYTLEVRTAPAELVQQSRWFKEALELNTQGLKLLQEQKVKDAATAFARSLGLFEKVYPSSKYPKGAANLATVQSNLALCYQRLADYAKAEPLYKQALEIRRQVQGEKHPDFATSLNSLAVLYRYRGDYAKAEPLYKQALEIKRQALGEKHPDFALSLNNLALLYESQGDYARAEPLLKQALETRRQVLGEKHLDFAASLNNLAGLHQSQGDYAKAEPLYKQALEIFRQALGEKHLDFATSLNNLALMYQYQADYAKAEPLCKQALEIYRQVLGERHPNLAASLNNLAGIYRYQGDYAKAEPLYKQALEIKRQVLGERHPEFALSLRNLGELYKSQGGYAQAEPLYKQALEIFRQALGERHPGFAMSLNDLGGLYHSQREYAKAEPLYQQALEIKRQALGEKHNEFVASLNNLAMLYQSQGDHAKAEPLFTQALEIRRQVLGEKHPDVALSLNNLAGLYRSQENYAKAEPLFKQGVGIVRAHLEESAITQSERQQMVHRDQGASYYRNFLLATSNSPGEGAYDVVLSWKGAITMRQRLTRIARTGFEEQPQAQALFRQLEAASRGISVWSSKNPASLPKGFDLSKKLAELTAEREDLEGKLSGQTEAFRRLKQSQKLTTADLQKLLPEETVLVDFVEYDNRVAAFVVSKHQTVRLELGAAKPLQDAVDDFRQTLKRPEPGKEGGQVLRQKLLDPLDRYLAGAKQVLIAPDGPLHSLPFAALPGKTPGKYLIEETAIAIVPVPQMLSELLALGKDLPAVGLPTMLALGDVDFDWRPGKAPREGTTEARRIVALSGERTGHALQWSPLPGTSGELDTIEKLFRKSSAHGTLTSLRGQQASESVFRAKAPGHDYLHVATHGFFAPREIKKMQLAEGSVDNSNRPVIGHHPGLLSGLVFAGANHAGSQEDDGILTALEVGELDLTKVRLAVLSACETGLGETAGGEGVLGLQRAFQVAGARSVITTLWSIPDEPTRVLMERFYSNLWSKKMSKLDALREAQLWMLREGRANSELQRGIARMQNAPRPQNDGRLPPYYWAAFVLSGDWR